MQNQQTQQKINQAANLKQKGNQLYSQKEFVKALRAYHQANLFLSGLLDKNSPMAMYSTAIVDDITADKIKELKFSIFMNMGQIYIIQEKYSKGIQILAKASEIKENNKLRYRKAICLMNLGQFQKSRELLKKVGENDPTMKEEVEKHLQRIKGEEKKVEQKSKKMFKKFFE